MNNELKMWLANSDIVVDSMGRVIIENVSVISEINGALNMLPNGIDGDLGCGGGCDHCDGGCNCAS